MIPFLILIVFMMVFATVIVMSVTWVWRDASTRGKPGFGIAAVVGLTWPVGLLLWVVFRPQRKPGYTPAAIFRFSIGSILGLTAALALIFLAVAQDATYRTHAILRVRREMAVGDAAQYITLKESISRDLNSQKVIDQAVLEVLGRPDEGTSRYLIRNLKITFDETELLSLVLSGGRSDGEDFLGRILDVYLRDVPSENQVLSEYGNLPMPGLQIVLPPRTISRPPWAE